MGFVIGCAFFAILGAIVLACVPKLSFTVVNLILFVVGAFTGTYALAYLYGRAFADSNHELNGTVAEIGIFTVMLVGGIIGGTILVWLKMRIVKSSANSR